MKSGKSWKNVVKKVTHKMNKKEKTLFYQGVVMALTLDIVVGMMEKETEKQEMYR
jgi:hypothetical protein